MKGIIITPEGVVAQAEVEENGQWLYKLIHAVVGGYFEEIKPYELVKESRKDLLMAVNAEGLCLPGFRENAVASALYGAPIAGNAVILKSGYHRGELDTVALGDMEANEIMNHIARIADLDKEEAVR